MRHRTLEVTSPVTLRVETTDNPAALLRELCAVADEFPGQPVSFTVTTNYEDETPPVVRNSSSSRGEAAPGAATSENTAPGSAGGEAAPVLPAR